MWSAVEHTHGTYRMASKSQDELRSHPWGNERRVRPRLSDRISSPVGDIGQLVRADGNCSGFQASLILGFEHDPNFQKDAFVTMVVVKLFLAGFGQAAYLAVVPGSPIGDWFGSGNFVYWRYI